MKSMQFLLSFDKNEWEDNCDFLSELLKDIRKRYNRKIDFLVLFQDKNIPKYFLKIYFTIQERFLLNDNKENKSLFPIYFFNIILKLALNFNECQKIALHSKLIRFICEKYLFRDEFCFETAESFDEFYTFGNKRIQNWEISLPYLEIIIIMLRKYQKIQRKLKKLNISMKFIQRKDNVEHFLMTQQTYPYDTYILLYEISSYFYDGKNGNYFQINSTIFEIYCQGFLNTIGAAGYDDSFFIHILEFLERASIIDENSEIFLTGRFNLIKMFKAYSKSDKYITNILLNLTEKNCWEQLPNSDMFFLQATLMYKRVFGGPYDPKEKKVFNALKNISVFFNKH